MPGCFQVLMVLCLLCGAVTGADKLQVEYEAAKVERPMFMRGVSMLGREQDEYAMRLAANAARLVRAGEGDGVSVRRAERFLAVARHLSPRNRAVEEVTESLEAGLVPDRVKGGDYYGKVFARLLMVRGKLLLDGGTERDRLLGRCFYSLALELDPGNKVLLARNESATERLGVVNWDWLMGREPK